MATITKRRWKTSKGEPREAWVLAYTDAQGKRHKEQHDLKRSAEARRVEVEGQVRTGTYRAEANTVTVEDAVKDYLKHLKTRLDRGEHVTKHYHKTTEAQLYNYVAPQPGRPVEFSGGIGAVKLSQCTAKVVGDFRDRLRDAGVGVVTTRRILGSLSRALKHAVDNDYLAINPAAGIRVTGKRGEGEKKVELPAKADVAAVIAGAKGGMAVRLRLSASAGLRASELYALRWRHVSFNGGELSVEGRVDAYGNLDTSKSTAGVRQVPLSSAMLADLRAWKDQAKKADADDLIFPNSKGGYMSHNNAVKREFRPLLAAVKAKAKEDGRKFKPFNWHALRHFAISLWIESGLQPKTVQTFAGHSSLAVTMSRYGKLFPSDDHKKAMDAISSSIFGGAADGAQMAHETL